MRWLCFFFKDTATTEIYTLSLHDALPISSAYALVREQFGLPIGKFEGVRERLARIAGHAYFMNAARRLAFGAVDAGEKPSVISAVVKAYLTEGARTCINDAMDIHAGSAICRGPQNIFARPYDAIPVGITVEGANILTRSLIIFGQGAIRCHPFVQKEMKAAGSGDVRAFDAAFFGHLAHIVRTKWRVISYGLTGGVFVPSPVSGFEAKYYKAISRYSAIFSLTADLALATLGGAMKRKEHLSGRFSDAFAWMFLAAAALKHFHVQGRPANQRAYLDWACTHALYETEAALFGVLDNLPGRFMAAIVRRLAFPFGPIARPLNDRQIEACAERVLSDQDARDAITNNIYLPAASDPGLGALDGALAAVLAAGPARAKLDKARREGKIAKTPPAEMAAAAAAAGIITSDDAALIESAEKARDAVIQVSDFDPAGYDGIR